MSAPPDPAPRGSVGLSILSIVLATMGAFALIRAPRYGFEMIPSGLLMLALAFFLAKDTLLARDPDQRRRG